MWRVIATSLLMVPNKEFKMTLRSLLMGAVASATLAPAAFAERGADGEVNIIYWQAPFNP